MKPGKSLIYFLSHPIQYFSPLLKKLSQASDLKVYYFSDAGITGNMDKGFGQAIQWDTPLNEGYTYRILRNFSRRKSLDSHLLDAINPGVINVLWKDKSPVVIVNGWSYGSSLLVIFFGRLFGKKIWLRAENPLNQELEKNRWIIFLKKILLKQILFRLFISKCLYIGTESRLFFEFYGVRPQSLLYTPYSVDNAFFSGEYKRISKDPVAARTELGLPADKKIILFSGKYIFKKRPMDLLRAFQMLNNSDYALVMVGEGELRGEMEKYIADHGLKQVYLTGFINQSFISRYYTVADVYVMCSGTGETWGLAVNEAMNFEKPVIVSRQCGSSRDLVKHGENGFVFEAGNIPELAEYITKTLEDDNFKTVAGKRSVEIIGDYSIDHIVANIVAALN
jgi:glycosyltransferase involved in cell wall biosynthesis